MIWVDDNAMPPSQGRAWLTSPSIGNRAAARAARLAVVLLAGVTFLLLIGAYLYFAANFTVDGELERAGKAYPRQLGVAYAEAIEECAKLLDNGQSIDMATKQVGTTWDAKRHQLFKRHVEPLFLRIVPDTTKEDDVTDTQRHKLAEAWREFAKGLKK